MSVKQVILFRKDLHMRTGKIAASVAHASLKVFLDRKTERLNGYPTYEYLEAVAEYADATDEREVPEDTVNLLVIPLNENMCDWVDGIFTKVVLSVDSEEALLKAYTLAQEAGLPTALITDVGNTEFHGVATHTAVAIGPANSEDINKITGPQGAVSTKLA